MDTIVMTALIGTGQQSSPDITTGTALDPLATRLAGEGVERRLLLMAGAFACYRQAGQVAGPAPALPEAARSETLRPCSEKLARLLGDLLQGEHKDLLPEAFVLLEKANLHLPYELLPLVLFQGMRDQLVRARLYPLLGERGYWLSQFNISWSWVNNMKMLHILPADSDTLWQEGTVEQRTELLRRLRATDPARALEWLKAVWKQEKVDARAAFLATLAVGLSMADQPFLERALDDRSESVRLGAAQLLFRLTTSPQALRLQACADDLLQDEDGRITVTLPASIDKAWIYTVSLLKLADDGSTSRFYWPGQALSRVSPTHWEERFCATPAQILSAIRESEWASEVVNALTDAALFHATADWFQPLMDWYAHKMKAGTLSDQEISSCHALLSHLPQHEAENWVRGQFARQDSILQFVQQLPTPWSDGFSADCVQILQDYHHTFKEYQPAVDQWVALLKSAAIALAPSCFAAALTGWTIVDVDNSVAQYWNAQLDAFLQKIRIRKSLLEEIQ